MPKIRITCNDPCATDSSSGEDDGSIIEDEGPTTGAVFVEEISVSVPLLIPAAISTVHLDSLANLKSDSSFKVDESKSSRDGPNCIVLALSSRSPEHTLERKSGILSVHKRLEKSYMAQKGQVDATILLSKEDGLIEPCPTSINVAVDIPVAEKSRRRGSSGHPGVHMQSSGKWGVRVRDPITKNRIWVGSYSTLEEAITVHNKKKLEYAPLRSEMAMRGSLSVQNTPEKLSIGQKSQLDITSSLLQEDGSAKVTPTSIDVAGASMHPGLQLSSKMGMQDDSSRAEESKCSLGEHHCIVLGLSSRQPGDTQRKKSGVFPIRNRLDKSSMAIDVPIAKNSTGLGMEKRVGLQLQSSGRWGVKIYNPIKKAQIWLGTYSTVEEANNAFDKKKLEFASLSPAVFNHKKHSMRKAKRKLKKLVVEGITVYETKSGKWGARIKDPVSRLKLWLGSHDTPEEAVESYNRKMLEFESSYDCGIVGKIPPSVLDSEFSGKEAVNDECIPDVDDTCIPASHDTPKEAVKSYDRIMLEFDSSYNFDSEGKISSVGKEAACIARALAFDVADDSIPAHDVASSFTRNNAEFECPVRKLTETDKWRVAIRHPMLKCSISLGSYDTPEEAAEVYNKKQLELETVLNRDKITGPSRSSDVACSAAVDSNGLPVKKIKGVKLCRSGRWMAQIQPPFTRQSKVYLGTFNTVEEAAEAFNRTRREFDAIRSLVSKRKHEGDSEAPKKKMKKKHKAELLSRKTIIFDEASMTDDERSHVFEILVAPESYSHQHKLDDCAFTAMSGQASNNSNERQILSPAEHDIGMGVINSFGQLVGEYSRLDDELWLSRPGDDEFDVNVAMGGGDIGELAWDPDLKPSPF